MGGHALEPKGVVARWREGSPTRVLTLTLLISLVLPLQALAGCHVEWDCSRGYPCRQVQVCDSPIDIPAIPMPSISPIPPPSITPIPQPVVPPIGTTQCRQAYLCDNFGRCTWQTVCR